MIKKIFQEEFFIPFVALTVLVISLLPFGYEIASVKKIPADRYPLFESDFAPDMRFYISRMREGYDGQWLVTEKYTSEEHQPSILHISYLIIGKISGIFGIDPVIAFPLWRLICGFFLLFSGYFFIYEFIKEKKLRISAFLLFVFAGNLPILVRNGISLFGFQFALNLSWYTFFDPVKRLIFLPHYNLSAAFLAITFVFLWRGIRSMKRTDFAKAGLFGFLASIILPQSLFVIILSGVLLIPFVWPKRKNLIGCLWPFFSCLVLAALFLGFSLSYFPWNVQSQADAAKRYLGFDTIGVFLGLGTTAILGLLGIFWVIRHKREEGYISVAFLSSVILQVVIFTIIPFSNSYRPLQIDLHLPLAVISTILLQGLVTTFFSNRKEIFRFFVILTLLPSLFVWIIGLKAQTSFVELKIAASYPLIPQGSYVVYPLKSVMEALFWLRDKTRHDEVVLAGETLGSMVPAYSGNTVYLGHGNQTVYFDSKLLLMKMFYRGEMTSDQARDFLKKNRIAYVWWGTQEREISGRSLNAPDFEKVYENSEVIIFRVEYGGFDKKDI